MARRLLRSLGAALWFMFLTFPILVLRVNPLKKTIEWRWGNMLAVGAAAFVGSLLWSRLMERRERGAPQSGVPHPALARARGLLAHPKLLRVCGAALLVLYLVFPLFGKEDRVDILITAMIWVILGLGLNIVVGLAGLLDLGYVAFYAVGAYSYALLNLHYGVSFWLALPVGALVGAFFGVLLGIPVLRLRGDYLAIVTLGFGEIIRLILENWGDLSQGPSGIANIPMPSLFGITLDRGQAFFFLYYLLFALVLFTVFVVDRLRNSRLGRSWIALREDEIACQAMGVDRMRTKLAAFALGATWAGMAGVLFAAKTTFINPASFTFFESALILSIVVLGGMGSIAGVVIAALVLVILPKELQAFSEYRMLLFGAAMVLMMLFRPQGLVPGARRRYEYSAEEKGERPA
jgi:branched-chain amino acid transport system permease protein